MIKLLVGLVLTPWLVFACAGWLGGSSAAALGAEVGAGMSLTAIVLLSIGVALILFGSAIGFVIWLSGWQGGSSVDRE